HDVGVRAGAGTPAGLADVPAAEWDAVTPAGGGALGVLGGWQRRPARGAGGPGAPGPGAAAPAPPPGPSPAPRGGGAPRHRGADGSGCGVGGYPVGARFGGRAGLADARSALAARGVRLLVDFVPNHVAPDHPWLAEHPDRFVRGTAGDLARDPAGFLAVGDAV